MGDEASVVQVLQLMQQQTVGKQRMMERMVGAPMDSQLATIAAVVKPPVEGPSAMKSYFDMLSREPKGSNA